MGLSGLRSRGENGSLVYYSPDPFKRIFALPSSESEANWNAARSFVFSNPDFGFMSSEDFAPGSLISATSYGGFTVTQYTAGSLEMQDEVGGVLGLKTTTTATQGIQMQSMGEAWKPAAGKKIWFECKLRVSPLLGYVEFFAGLIETNSDIAKGATPAAVNTIGLRKVAAGSLIHTHVSTGSTASVASTTSFIVDNYHHIGFFVDGISSVSFYATNDGQVPVLIRTDTTNIPTTEMALSFGARRTVGASENSLFIDWYKIIQTR